MTAVAAICAVAVTAWSVRYTAEAVKSTSDQLEISRQQVSLARQQQNADRFGRAIDQLGQEGSDKLSIRLGGIYSLETLMSDSPEYRPTVVEVLGSFVRGHARRPGEVPPDADNDPPSPADVRSAVTVLGHRPEPSPLPLDFGGTLLGLEEIALTGADLHGVHLVHADLRDAVLSNANLRDAQLDESSLGGADLRNSHLDGSDLGGAFLGGAHLEGATMKAVQMSEPLNGQMDCVWVDATTVLPEGVKPPSIPPDKNPACR